MFQGAFVFVLFLRIVCVYAVHLDLILLAKGKEESTLEHALHTN
jgi:hypothetical protein